MSERTPSGVQQFESLVRQIHFMKQYCASAGVAIPEAAARAIAEVEAMRVALANAQTDSKSPLQSQDVPVVTPIPLGTFVGDALKIGWVAHSQLAALVRPATPGSIEWTTAPPKDPHGRQRLIFVVGNLAAAVLTLAAFIFMLYDDAKATARTGRVQQVTALVGRLAEGWRGEDPSLSDLVMVGTVVREEAIQLRRARSADDGLYDLVKDTDSFLSRFLNNVRVDGTTRSGDTPYDLSANRPELDGLVTRWRSYREAYRAALPDGSVPDYLLLAIAGALGAAFFNLYCAHQYIVERTFDPAHINKYIIRFFLGVVSGLVLGHFGGELIKMFADPSSGVTMAFSRAFLAILGGYAVDAVNLILVRVAESISTLFRGGTTEIVKAKTAEAESKAEKAAVDQRMKLAKQLQELRGSISNKSAQDDLEDIIDGLLG